MFICCILNNYIVNISKKCVCSRYKEAESRFLEALDRIKQIKQPIIANKWESLFNNLGHVYRKLENYEKALEYHKQVI